MVDLTQCIFATPGAFEEEEETGGENPGIVVTVVDHLGPQTEGTRTGFPEDDGGIPPNGHDRPVCSGPDICFVPQDGEYDTVICSGGPVSIEDTTTTTFCVSGGEEIEEVPFDVGGPLVEGAPEDLQNKFSAQLKGFRRITSAGDWTRRLELHIQIPTSQAALDYYKGLTPAQLQEFTISGSFTLQYQVNFFPPDSSHPLPPVDWARFTVDLSFPGYVQLSDEPPEAQPPTIDYGGLPLTFHYAMPEGRAVQDTVNPTAEGWDLGNYEVVAGSERVAIPGGGGLGSLNLGNNVDINLNTGTLTVNSTEDSLVGVILENRTAYFAMYLVPQDPYVGPHISYTTEISFPIEFISGADTEQDYPKAAITVFTNDDTQPPLTYILEPTSWPTETDITWVSVYADDGDQNEYDDILFTDENGDTDWYGSNILGATPPKMVVEYVDGKYTGKITFESIPSNFITAPPAFVRIDTQGPAGDIEFNIPITTTDALPFSTGGGPGTFNLSKVSNKNLDISISVPTSLLGVKAPIVNAPVKSSSNVVPISRKSYIAVNEKPISPRQEAEKREFTTYVNGITNNPFTYISTRTITDPILLKYGAAGSVFGEEVDETVRGVIRVNKEEEKVVNYFYNALTKNKVIDSFDPTINTLLTESLDINGRPLKDLFGVSIRDSLVRNEQNYFKKSSLLGVKAQQLNTTPRTRTNDRALNNSNAMEIVINKSISIDPNSSNIKAKNRLLNWKSLAEDLNKRVVYKTADGTEYNIYIPNSEIITVVDADGDSHNLEMQDGDYFNVYPVVGEDILLVFSDVEKARILPHEEEMQAAYLANDTFRSFLDVTSVTSDLVEYNVDTTGARQEYYFLSLDKSTVENLQNDFSNGDTLFTRKTQATYNYTVTGIDSIVKHRAFPAMLVYLRHDDMFFNHLDNSKKATLIHKDFTLNNFTNTPSDFSLVRQLPQHMLIVPSDRTEKVVTHGRSLLMDFNKRRVSLRPSPFKKDQISTTNKPLYLKPELTTTESINFSNDILNNVVYQEDTKYVFDTTAVGAIDRYTSSTEPLPRKEMPTTKALVALNNIKTVYSLTSRDKIGFYDLYSRLLPEEFIALGLDQSPLLNFRSRLINNNITEDKTINETYFLPVKEISNIDNVTPVLLPSNPLAPIVSGKRTEAGDTGSTGREVRDSLG